uniref:Zinc finger protein 385C n=1 Tax=Salarias fasciatus TaxID=181472 RepID=A0A672FNA3_SALFA
MKRPKSSEWLDNGPLPKSQAGQDEEEEEDEEEEKRVGVAGLRAKRERRQGSGSATMCQVCNIQLNSSAQAQIHYRGKTHQRRLRRLAKAVSAGTDAECIVYSSNRHMEKAQTAAVWSVPDCISLPECLMQNFINPYFFHFLPLRVNGSSPLSLFPNFNTMDPVQKAVINHTFGVAPPKKKPIISCNICHLRFNSTTQAEAHYKGHKHARKLKALETQRNRQKNGPSQSTAPARVMTWLFYSLSGISHSSLSFCLKLSLSSLPFSLCSAGGEEEAVQGEELKEAKSNKKHLHCPTCKVTVNSSSQLEAHCSGSKHKQMLDGQNSSQSQRRVKMTSSPRPACRIKQRMGSKPRAVVGVTGQPFHCELCQVSVNSETQLKQHMNSRRHKERLAGKPVKAKFSPYNKLQPSAVLATKLALHKQLSKALPAGFLTSPLNPAALCTMASGPLALRLPPGPTAIIQGPLISPTLFRPAPGPLRATHTPIIFSPY